MALAALAFAPASAFIANEYRTDNGTPSGGAASGGTTTTLDTSPTTLLNAVSVAKDLTRDNYPAFGLSFQRPKHWRAQTFPGHTSGASSPIVYLSSDELSNPCDSGTSGETECGWPIEVISPNAPLITWTLSVDAPPPPPNTVIGGQSARVESAKPGACRAVQGEETIVAAIPRPSGGVFYMRACLSGDELAAAEQNTYAMLASVQVS
jgi:hypothetical protein